MSNSNFPFNVMRHAKWERSPRVQAVATFVGGALFGGGVLTATQMFIATAIASIGISAVTSWALAALAPKPDFSSFGSQGTLVNTRDATAPADFVYGEVRKGGTVSYYESTGAENAFLHQIIVLAGHEVDEIGDIYVNDEVVTLDGNGFVTDDAWVIDDGDNPSGIRIQKFDGSQTTAPADLLAESELTGSDALTTDFVGNGIAYLYVRYEYNQDVFASGVPLVTAVVRGKKVYDPRTDTTAYSNNAALCMRDYITSEYGLNDSAIDDVAFSAAANESDEDVSLSGSGTEKRYTINGIVKASSPVGKVLGDMATACAGTLFWGSGYWKLKVGAYTSPVKTLTLDDLRGPINLSTRSTMRDSFNGVTGTFNNASADYITADYPPIKSSAFQAEDGGDELLLDLPLPFTTSAATAQRIAKMTLYRGREQMTISADFGLEAFNVEVGDIIAFTNERYGFDEKEFEVIGWKFSSNQDAGDLRVNLTLQETSAAAFDWNAEETEIISNNTNLPAFTSGMNVNGLSVGGGGRTQSDGTRISTAILSWAAVQNAYVDQYEVQWRPTADSSYSTTYTSNNTIELSPIVDSIEYTFLVRAVLANGYRGPFTSITFTGGGDTNAPAAPTNISANGGYKYITISFDRPNDSDFNQVEVYEKADDVFSGSYSVGFTSGNSFIRSNLSNAITRYYWLRSIDFSGNQSSFVGPVSAQTALVSGEDLTASLLDTINSAGVDAVNSLPASGDYDGQLVFLLADNTLYRWDDAGSSWSTELFTDIKDDSITTDKIAASAVVASKIAAGTITADKLNVSELSAVTADLGTVSAGRLQSADGNFVINLTNKTITISN